MKKLALSLLLCFTPHLAEAFPLKVVNVSAPAINCVFNPACTIPVSDTVANVTLSTGGTGRLQSRTFTGAPGSPGAGFYGYEYRLDLTEAVGLTAIACIDWMKIKFGPVVSTLNYGGDVKPDQVYVVTGGGLGTIGISSAVQIGNTITFTFASPVCAGGSPGRGDTTFFWGLASRTPPRFVTASLHETFGTLHTVQARAPRIGRRRRG